MRSVQSASRAASRLYKMDLLPTVELCSRTIYYLHFYCYFCNLLALLPAPLSFTATGLRMCFLFFLFLSRDALGRGWGSWKFTFRIIRFVVLGNRGRLHFTLFALGVVESVRTVLRAFSYRLPTTIFYAWWQFAPCCKFAADWLHTDCWSQVA